MDWRVVLLLGTLLMAVGPGTPAVLGDRYQAVVVVDLGQRGGAPRRPAAELDALARAEGFETKVLAPGAVEVTAPAAARDVLDDWARKLALPPDAASVCSDGTCAVDALSTAPLFNRASGPMDPAALRTLPAGRGAWLAGMAVGLLGVAITVLALLRRPVVTAAAAGPWWLRLVLGALVGAALGAGVAAVRPAVVEQVLVVKPAQRPRLMDEPLTRDALEETHRVVARLQGPGFGGPLGVTVHPMAMGNGLLVHAEAADEAALDALLTAVREKLVEPDARATAATAALLELPCPQAVEAARVRMLGELQAPSVVARPRERGPRGPWVVAPWMALVGALVAFAARPVTRR